MLIRTLLFLLDGTRMNETIDSRVFIIDRCCYGSIVYSPGPMLWR